MSDRRSLDLQPALAILRSGNAPYIRAGIIDLAAANHLSPAALYNALSVSVARRFLAGDMPFEEADEMVNTIYGFMVEDGLTYGEDFEFPEPAFAIYGAFDMGEWNPRDGFDGVERYTRPALLEILSLHADPA